MPDRRHEGDAVQRAVASALSGHDRVILAVSGGVDSMVLLHAAASLTRNRRPSLLVASFDHGTGTHARRAVELVRRKAKELGLSFVTAKADSRARTEHEWREARWAFLRHQAKKFGGAIATAHTLDDQIETVFMRILRDAGPRGLAALYADSEIIRPLLSLKRDDIARYAREHKTAFISDPTNDNRAHLRNRVRHELLPAIARVRPTFPAQLISIARKSAEWRSRMSLIADRIDAEKGADGSLRITRDQLRGFDVQSLRVLWPSIAARADIVMDRRGTHRLAEFTMKGVTGGSIQLSGGVEVLMFRDHMVLRHWDPSWLEALRSSRLSRSMSGSLRQVRS
jgi:tRNA(Ile)-lysidine synthase